MTSRLCEVAHQKGCGMWRMSPAQLRDQSTSRRHVNANGVALVLVLVLVLVLIGMAFPDSLGRINVCLLERRRRMQVPGTQNGAE